MRVVAFEGAEEGERDGAGRGGSEGGERVEIFYCCLLGEERLAEVVSWRRAGRTHSPVFLDP